jgi:hypothetical protein
MNLEGINSYRYTALAGSFQPDPDPLSGIDSSRRLIFEHSGIYYEAFGREIPTQFAEPLASKRLEYYLINPHLVKEARTVLQRGRVRKTDAIDTQAIARCLQQGDVMPARLPDGHALLFQQWALRFRRTQHNKRRLENHLMTQMDRLWPGAFVNVKRFKRQHPDLDPPVPLVETRPLERKLVQVILTHCPNPYDVLAGTPPQTRVITQVQLNQGLSNASEGLQFRSKQRRNDRIRGVRRRT